MISPGGLFTDFYELTMAQGYMLQNHNPGVVFDMFFRRPPFGSGFTIFAGLQPVLESIEKFSFTKEDCEYLRSLGVFQETFLEYLLEFRFTGNIWACDEGTVVFPNEPIIRIEANLCEAQLIESLVLNTINFQTLIATKTARICLAARGKQILEFGMRRAQGKDGAFSATRAAFIGGAEATSNTYAGKNLDIPVRGTMAHSWIMSYTSELEAFRKYAELYPDSSVFLMDTYDTLESGLKNAVIVGKELIKKGITRFGVRLDSGDLEYLSKEVRKAMDDAGLHDAFIVVSNELSEEIIQQLVVRKSPIDIWGVGTNLVTAKDDPALTGVYKLAEIDQGGIQQPVMKISNNPEKMTNPGRKQVFRFLDAEKKPLADLIALEDEHIQESVKYRFYHPLYEYSHFDIEGAEVRPLLSCVMKKGIAEKPCVPLHEIQHYVKSQLGMLDQTYTRLLNPHEYKVSLSEQLKTLKVNLILNAAKKGAV
ncbi:MAG: nicotinate phosphoribosyltransferase [Spirochaetales bacterium]|nr:nicotinate phosphoribosyltransferase [Spirochaetales bacterium]